MRCAYCHNPDTWNETSDDAKFMTVEELWDQVNVTANSMLMVLVSPSQVGKL